MLVFKFNGDRGIQLAGLKTSFEHARKQGNEAEKALKAIKTEIGKILQSDRSILLDLLPEKESVTIQIEGNGGFLIQRKGSDRIDVDALRASEPDLALLYTRRGIASYFDPLN